MIDMDIAIAHMQSLKGISYSMEGSRTGEDGTGDCSGTVYASLRKAGATDAGWVLNTDSMHAWLVQNGFTCIAINQEWEAKRGDIVIFGQKGNSAGSAGHVVIYTEQYRIIHCTWKDGYNNGIYEDDSETVAPYSMGFYVYRLEGQQPLSKPKPEKVWVKDDKGWWLTNESRTGYYKGWQKVKGIWYYLDTKTGYMKRGWQKIDKDWYYFNGSGHMLIGWQKLNGFHYYLDEDGSMIKGWINEKGTWYYTRKQKDGDYPEGSEVFGWLFEKDKWYYFGKDGKMIRNERKIVNGVEYVFDAEGVCLNYRD